MKDPHFINHSQFKALHAVAKSGGFTAAAKDLGITQPAITHQIRELENHYRTELFQRDGRSIYLTPTGSQLLELSQRYFRIAEEAHSLLTSLLRLEGGLLRIASDLPSRAFALTDGFQIHHPKMELDLTLQRTSHLYGLLEDHVIDLALTGAPLQGKSLTSFCVRAEPSVIALPLSHPLAVQQEILPAELQEYEIYILREEEGETKLQNTLFQKAHLDERQIHYFENRDFMIETALRKGGALFMPHGEIAHDSRLKSVVIADRELLRRDYVSFLKARSENPVISAFCAHLKTEGSAS